MTGLLSLLLFLATAELVTFGGYWYGRWYQRVCYEPLIEAAEAYLWAVQDELTYPEPALAAEVERLTGWTVPQEPGHRP